MMTQWTATADQVPPHGNAVIISVRLSTGKEVSDVAYFNDEANVFTNYDGATYHFYGDPNPIITHWAEMPKRQGAKDYVQHCCLECRNLGDEIPKACKAGVYMPLKGEPGFCGCGNWEAK